MGCLIQAQDPEGLTRSVSDTSVVVNMLEGPVMESPIDRSSVYDQGMSKTGARFLYAKNRIPERLQDRRSKEWRCRSSSQKGRFRNGRRGR